MSRFRLLLVLAAFALPARAATVLDCDRVSSPYEADSLANPPGPACLSGGPTGSFLRLADTSAVNINAMDYITVARARGEKMGYLIRSEILPGIIRPVLADFGLRFVFIVLLLSSMSFLGLGVQPPFADWGALVKENIGGLTFAAPAVVLPSIAIASLTISVNLLIDNLPQKIRDRSE